MNDKTFIKEYIGIVHKVLENDNGTIDLPIARKPGSIMLRHISPDGDPAVTHYTVLERLNGATLVKFRLETGRTHQIRFTARQSVIPFWVTLCTLLKILHTLFREITPILPKPTLLP